MTFIGKKHSEETKKKISASRKKYTGKNHPRYNAEWTDDQRSKYILTMYQRKEEEKKIKLFLIKYDSLYKNFNLTNK